MDSLVEDNLAVKLQSALDPSVMAGTIHYYSSEEKEERSQFMSLLTRSPLLIMLKLFLR